MSIKPALLRYFIPFLLCCGPVAQAKLNVVATLPDLGSIAHEIGKDKIDLVVLGKPKEDPHYVDPRPDLVTSLRNADVLIDNGADLELGWLPPLLQKANNPKIDIGKPGRVQASEGVTLVNPTPNVTIVAGDAHGRGNPHFMVDPVWRERRHRRSRNRSRHSTHQTRHFTKRAAGNLK